MKEISIIEKLETLTSKTILKAAQYIKGKYGKDQDNLYKLIIGSGALSIGSLALFQTAIVAGHIVGLGTSPEVVSNFLNTSYELRTAAPLLFGVVSIGGLLTKKTLDKVSDFLNNRTSKINGYFICQTNDGLLKEMPREEVFLMIENNTFRDNFKSIINKEQEIIINNETQLKDIVNSPYILHSTEFYNGLDANSKLTKDKFLKLTEIIEDPLKAKINLYNIKELVFLNEKNLEISTYMLKEIKLMKSQDKIDEGFNEVKRRIKSLRHDNNTSHVKNTILKV